MAQKVLMLDTLNTFVLFLREAMVFDRIDWSCVARASCPSTRVLATQLLSGGSVVFFCSVCSGSSLLQLEVEAKPADAEGHCHMSRQPCHSPPPPLPPPVHRPCSWEGHFSSLPGWRNSHSSKEKLSTQGHTLEQRMHGFPSWLASLIALVDSLNSQGISFLMYRCDRRHNVTNTQ